MALLHELSELLPVVLIQSDLRDVESVALGCVKIEVPELIRFI